MIIKQKLSKRKKRKPSKTQHLILEVLKKRLHNSIKEKAPATTEAIEL